MADRYAYGVMAEPLPIDLDQLNMVSNNDPYDREFVVAIYLRETAKDLQKLADAIENSDAKEVYRIAHGCVGSSQSYGMSAVVASLKQMEIESREGRLQNARLLFDQTQQQFQRILTFAKSLNTLSEQSKAA